VQIYVKRRDQPVPGSIPAALDSFRKEVRFYRLIAPVVGVRVPLCYRAEVTDRGTVLELEDLSAWQPGADPVAAARVLSAMHRRWAGEAERRWPWLRADGVADHLVAELFDDTWPMLAARNELTGAARAVGERLVGNVAAAERAVAATAGRTMVHGDASMLNMRTAPDGEIALLDWEDVISAPGTVDLAWMLVSSVHPDRWDEVIAAYGPGDLEAVLPSLIVQGLLSMSDTAPGSAPAAEWAMRLDAAARRVAA
jgi:aminoglycoside phosphotransferase (APT) family kinase protein